MSASLPCASGDVAPEVDPFEVALDACTSAEEVHALCLQFGLDEYGANRVANAWRLTRGPTRPMVLKKNRSGASTFNFSFSPKGKPMEIGMRLLETVVGAEFPPRKAPPKV